MKWLTPGGVTAALVVGTAITRGLGWHGLLVLGVFFISGSLLTQLAEHRGPRRTARQVVANGGVAAVAALLGSWSAATGALAAAAADTWATEIGAFSPLPPRMITSGARVPRGTSGGITILGTLGGVGGALTIGLLAATLAPAGARLDGTAPVAVAGVVGMLADSLAGAMVQAQFECPRCGARFERGHVVCHEPVRLVRGWRWLDNDAVNLIATLCGAALALVGSRYTPR